MRTVLRLLTFCVLSVFLTSCSSSKMAQVEQGTEYAYEPGHPEFYMNAFGFIDEEQGPMLEISTHITKGSLVYNQKDDSLAADVTVYIQIVDKDNSENIIASKQFNETVKSTDESITTSREELTIDHNLQVDPSTYEVSVTVEDNNSDKRLSQTTETYIPATDEGPEAYTLSTIQMYGKENGDKEWSQISGYDVQAKMDSLRFVFQVLSPQTGKELTINSRLLEFDSDTSTPRSMTRNNYSPSSIEYKGIDYDEETEVQSSQRILTDYSSTFIEYKFANENRGNYRFEVSAQKPEDEEEQFRARAFGIKSPNFPSVMSARELARPLVYLMGSKEYDRLMEISDQDSLKQEVDRFWLKNVGNKREARRVIELYYTRVEEANKQYSNFKEGWKTDLGMIYILFGTPLHTRDRLKRMIWYYTYNIEDPERRFLFEQPKLKNQYYPFYHYLLDRRNYYHSIQHNQRQLWLSGRILQRRI